MRNSCVTPNGDGLLCKMPKYTPPLSTMLWDIGRPSIKNLAKTFQVSETTVRKWLRDDFAPPAVMIAVFWITRWGASAIDCDAHNAAIMSAGLARSRKDHIEVLESRIQRLAQIANFGSANDPAPGVVPQASMPKDSESTSEKQGATELQPGDFRVDRDGSTPVSMRVSNGLDDFEQMRGARHAKTY